MGKINMQCRLDVMPFFVAFSFNIIRDGPCCWQFACNWLPDFIEVYKRTLNHHRNKKLENLESVD